MLSRRRPLNWRAAVYAATTGVLMVIGAIAIPAVTKTAAQTQAVSSQIENRPYDVVIFGATGFTGKLAVEYMLKTHGASVSDMGGIRWAMAARSAAKLKAVQQELGVPSANYFGFGVPILVVDALKTSDMKRLASSTRVVVSFVGPYLLYGQQLVAACAELGTHYVDITAETLFRHAMMTAHQASAEATGAVLISSMGYEALVFEFGAFLMQRAALKRYGNGAHLGWMRAYINITGAGPSGGTIATGAATAAYVASAKDASRLVAIRRDPFALAKLVPRPPMARPIVATTQGDISDAREHLHDPRPTLGRSATGEWVAYGSFVTLPEVWDEQFVQQMRVGMGLPPIGYAEAALIAPASSSYQQAKDALQRKLHNPAIPSGYAPQPGEGPDRALLDKGSAEVTFRGGGDALPAGAVLTARVSCDTETGYVGSAMMAVEGARCLATPGCSTAVGGGLHHTPASAMGDGGLMQRLTTYAGMRFCASSAEDGGEECV